MNRRLFVALEFLPMGDTAGVDEALCAREILPVAVVAHQLDCLAIGSLEDAGAVLVLGLRISTRQGLQLLARHTTHRALPKGPGIDKPVPRGPAVQRTFAAECFGKRLPVGLAAVKDGIWYQPLGV